MRIGLTGVTGLLGSNLLFEIFKQNINQLDQLKIFAFGRAESAFFLSKRLESLVVNDGCKYLGLTEKSDAELLKNLIQCIINIPYELTVDGLGLTADDFLCLKSEPIDYFFHLAALTDLRCAKTVEILCTEINIKGTQRILNLVESLNVSEFIYVGTAYSCGQTTGTIEPDYINVENFFRNPYEKSKLVAELLVKEVCQQQKMKYRVFRISVLGGRLIEQEIGSIHKFDVFYSLGAFLVKKKIERLQSSLGDLFTKVVELPMKVYINKDSGLNIVPVDYAAKMIAGACFYGDSSVYYHIAHPQITPHVDYGKWMLEAINVSSCIPSEAEPEFKNELEKSYYRTVGQVLTPYMIGEPMLFQVDNLKPLEKKMNICCPDIDKTNFMKLMSFAKLKNFGLNINPRHC
jgi:nucleoside-diphosphate-sugar epimerase